MAPGPFEKCVEGEKIFHLLEFEPATIKNISSLYNDCAMPVSGLSVSVINTVFVYSVSSSKAVVRYSDHEVLKKTALRVLLKG